MAKGTDGYGDLRTEKWTDGNGKQWTTITLPNGETRRFKTDDPVFEEVEIEADEIKKERKKDKSTFWVAAGIEFVVSIVALLALVVGATAIFPNSDVGIVTSIVSASYLASLVVSHFTIVGARIRRMELHALTVHQEVLRIQEQVNSHRDA